MTGTRRACNESKARHSRSAGVWCVQRRQAENGDGPRSSNTLAKIVLPPSRAIRQTERCWPHLTRVAEEQDSRANQSTETSLSRRSTSLDTTDHFASPRHTTFTGPDAGESSGKEPPGKFVVAARPGEETGVGGGVVIEGIILTGGYYTGFTTRSQRILRGRGKR